MTKDEAIAFLAEDGGHLRVPCSRYGSNSAECAEVAWAAFNVLERESGESADERESLDYVMGLVVNNHDDIEYLISNYGTDEEKETLDS